MNLNLKMQKTMKKILLIATVFTTLSVNSLFAQYDELRILYADKKYEKVVKVADKMTSNDDYKKDPMAYFWLSRGLYKVSQSGSSDPAFKNAFKESVNALGKFFRNDKDGELMKEDEVMEYIDEIQGSLVEQIKNEISTGNFRKASSWILTYKKVTKNVVGQIFLEAAGKYKADDKSGGLVLLKQGETELAKIDDIKDFTVSDKEILKLGLIYGAESYASVRQIDKAKELLARGKKWFGEDEEYKEAIRKF